MIFRQLFDPETSTYTYLLADEQTREACVIDAVLEHADPGLGLPRPGKIDIAVHANRECGRVA